MPLKWKGAILGMARPQNLNQPPGTLIYTGRFRDQETVLELITYDDGEFERKTIDTLEAVRLGGGMQWLNVTGLVDVALVREIGERFGISELVLENIVHVSQRSKLEDHGEFLFAVFKMIYLGKQVMISEHLAMVVMDRLVITFQETEGDVFESLRERIERGRGRVRSLGQDYLLFALVDALVDQHFDVLSHLGERLDALEEALIDEMDIPLDDLYRLRKDLLQVRSAVLPIKDIIHNITSQHGSHVSEEVEPYFKDVADHLMQVAEILSVYREMGVGLYETHMSNMNNNMNKVMTTLTVFSAIFIPLSFLAGVFGMNFRVMPGLENAGGFYWFMLGCGLMAGGMFLFFKSRRWF